MIREWYEDREVTTTVVHKILRRVCEAEDCEDVFDVTRPTHLYCSNACRQAQWQRDNPGKGPEISVPRET